MQVDSDPMKVKEALYSEPFECMMMETTDGSIEPLVAKSLAKFFKCMMVSTRELKMN